MKRKTYNSKTQLPHFSLTDDEGNILPYNKECEQSVLSSLMRKHGLYEIYKQRLSKDMFYVNIYQSIFLSIISLIEKGSTTSVSTIIAEAQELNMPDIPTTKDITDLQIAYAPESFEDNVKVLENLNTRRDMWVKCRKASIDAIDLTNDLDDVVIEHKSDIDDIRLRDASTSFLSLGEAFVKLKQQVDNNNQGKLRYLITGFKIFDDRYLLRPDTLTVIGAASSYGKTSLAMNICFNVAKAGHPCAYYSLEMGATSLAARWVAKDSNIAAKEIMNRRLGDNALKDLSMSMQKNYDIPIYIDDNATTSFEDIVNSIVTARKTKNIELAVVDYLQILTQGNVENEEKELARMTRVLKNTSKTYGLAIIALSQINRSVLHPTLSALRGSGQIVENSDNIVLIDRPEARNDGSVTSYEGEFAEQNIAGTAKLILVKGRDCGTASRLVSYDSLYTQFTDDLYGVNHDEQVYQKPEGDEWYSNMNNSDKTHDLHQEGTSYHIPF